MVIQEIGNTLILKVGKCYVCQHNTKPPSGQCSFAKDVVEVTKKKIDKYMLEGKQTELIVDLNDPCEFDNKLIPLIILFNQKIKVTIRTENHDIITKANEVGLGKLLEGKKNEGKNS